MKIKLIFSITSGDFQQGFGQVKINVYSQRANYQIPCHFNKAPELSKFYNNWREKYEALCKYRRGVGFKNEDDETDDFISEAESIAKSLKYIAECNKAFDCLRDNLNYWLNPVKEVLEQELDLNPEDEIDVVIQTPNISSESTNILQKLPWHWWDFFSQENFSDVAISFSNSKKVHSISLERIPDFPGPKRVKILGVLGEPGDDKDKDKIDVEADRRLLRKILGAYCVFLRQRTKAEFLDFMLRERWDILFFSGHSKTDKEANTGLLSLKPGETLDIQEIRETIQFNIDQYQGMKLAIFNSCDGLGLARGLAHLDIAQIIVWREPVPDKVAQEFLKYFLNNFTNLEEFPTGLSLYRSVQKARLEVQKYIENGNLPNISWLPVIHHNLAKDNPAKESISWKQLRQLPDTGIHRKKENPSESLLNRVEESWIKGVLEKSLHIEETIELGLSERLDAVIYPARRQEENSYQGISKQATIFTLYLLIQRGLDQLALLFLQYYSLPEGTRAIDVFGELENKRTMLILGEPGSGKTTALLEIAYESIIDARKDTTLPIPVVLNLSSWAAEGQQEPLAHWLVRELNRNYLFSKTQCQAWVKNQQLLLLLDGLDEIKKESQREDCIRAINQFLREYEKTEIVVCCRIQYYNKVSERLHFQSAVFYNSPTEPQINRYLDDAKKELLAVQ
ncbi:MAG: NACHT domain-containing protein [Moorea sp. SIO2B7]|nr:NACHT domain-containing protein [Moorena sp. SIO2B7]